MEQDRNSLLRTLVEKFEKQSTNSGGILSEAMHETLDQALRLLEEGLPIEHGSVEHLDRFEEISRLGPEFQAAMDVEILSMLTDKLAELDAIGKDRTLTNEEAAVKTTITNFINEIKAVAPSDGRE